MSVLMTPKEPSKRSRRQGRIICQAHLAKMHLTKQKQRVSLSPGQRTMPRGTGAKSEPKDQWEDTWPKRLKPRHYRLDSEVPNASSCMRTRTKDWRKNLKKRTMQLTVRKRLSCDNGGKKDMGKFIIPATCGNAADIKLPRKQTSCRIDYSAD